MPVAVVVEEQEVVMIVPSHRCLFVFRRSSPAEYARIMCITMLLDPAITWWMYCSGLHRLVVDEWMQKMVEAGK